MNNFTWQHFVRECKMIFILPLENRLLIWEQLLDLSVPQYHYDGREASPTHTGNHQSLLLYTKSWDAEEPRKTFKMHMNWLVQASGEKC
jgi:hypothetical protein